MNSHFERLHGHFTTLNSIRTPRLMRVVAGLLIAALTGMVLFITATPWVQTAAGQGVVTSLDPDDRVQDINALVSGRIERWFVRDGAAVRTGDPIVQISDNDPRLLERLAAERAEVSSKLRAAEAARAAARSDARRMQALFQEGLVARRDLELAQIKVSEFDGRVAEAVAERNRLDVGLSRQSAQIVRAPRDGVILNLTAGDVSTAVQEGDVVARFAPTGAALAVELFVVGRDAPLVRAGRKVRLQFEGWPAIQFSGWPSIAVGTFGGRVTSVDPSASVNGLFRVLVEADPASAPWPDQHFVRLGARARGWVLLETVPVGFEMWRQMNDFPPSTPADVASTGVAAGAP